jgi:hypothetical protein
MDRRRFLLASLAGALAAQLAAGTQQAVSPRRVGILLVGLSPESKEAGHFRQGLRDAGYSQNVVIEWRSAKGDYDRVPELVASRGLVELDAALDFVVEA